MKFNYKELSNYHKTLIKLGVISILGLSLSVGILNYSFQKNTEHKLSKLNGYTAPDKTYFQGMTLSFNNVSCSGFFNYDCHLDDIKIKMDSTEENIHENIFLAKEIIIKDIDSDNSIYNKNVNLNFEIKEITPTGYLEKSIKTEKVTGEAKFLNDKIFSNLFPLNLSFKLNSKRTFQKNENEHISGNFYISLSDKVFFLDLNSNFEVQTQDDFYTVLINSKGDLVKEAKSSEMMSEFNTGKKYSTKVKDFTFLIKDKQIFETSYDLYKLNMLVKNDFDKKELNQEYFDENTSEILSFSKFKDRLSVGFVLLKKESTIKFVSDLLQYTIEDLSIKKEIKVDGTNISGITYEQLDAILHIQEEDTKKLEIINKNFNIQTSTK